MLHKAGQEIQLACNEKQSIDDGEIAVVNAFKLPCKEVYFGYLQKWNSSHDNTAKKV